MRLRSAPAGTARPATDAWRRNRRREDENTVASPRLIRGQCETASERSRSSLYAMSAIHAPYRATGKTRARYAHRRQAVLHRRSREMSCETMALSRGSLPADPKAGLPLQPRTGDHLTQTIAEA